MFDNTRNVKQQAIRTALPRKEILIRVFGSPCKNSAVNDDLTLGGNITPERTVIVHSENRKCLFRVRLKLNAFRQLILKGLHESRIARRDNHIPCDSIADLYNVCLLKLVAVHADNRNHAGIALVNVIHLCGISRKGIDRHSRDNLRRHEACDQEPCNRSS